MTILAIDPGTHTTGLVWLDDDGSLIGWERLAPDLRLIKRLDHRLTYMLNAVDTVITELHPTTVVVERIVGGRKTMKPADELRSLITAIMGLVRRRKVQVVTYTPGQWRKMAHGHGGATKEESARWLWIRYPDLKVIPDDQKHLDVMDAAGLAKGHYEWSQKPELAAIAQAEVQHELTRIRRKRMYMALRRKEGWTNDAAML